MVKKTIEKAPAKSTRVPAKKAITAKVGRAVKAGEPVAEEKPKIDIHAMYDESLNVIAKRQGFESSGLDVAPPMSTGLLQLDMVMGGGIRASMLTGAGQEQCAKTTVALNVMGAAILANVPIIAFADYEGSTKNSKPYVYSILKGMGIKLSMDQVFGFTDKDGKHTPGRVRYRSETILERFYDWLSEILRELPDKRFVENKWWLVFDEKNKRHKAKVAEFVNTVMTKKYGNGLWVEAPDDKIQGIIFVDSYTAMQPESKDDESIGNQLSVKAAAFSKQLERVKGRMAQKMVTVYGLNHLRANPMAMFGPKETEKGGNALMQFCFAEDTLLVTDSGLVYAKDLALTTVPRATLGLKGAETPSAFGYMGHSQLVTVHTSMGYGLRCKPDHRMLTVTAGDGAFKPQWSHAKDMSSLGQRTTYVALKYGAELWPKQVPTIQFEHWAPCDNAVVDFDFPTKLTKPLARLLGYMVSEGYVRDGIWDFVIGDKDVYDDYVDCFKQVFCASEAFVRRSSSKEEPTGLATQPAYRFKTFSSRLYQFWRSMGAGGRRSADQCIPAIIRSAPRAYVVEFLKSLFEGDGSVGSVELSYSSKSSVLIKEVQLMLLNMGIITRKTESRVNWNSVELVNHVLYFGGEDRQRFIQEVGFISQRKIAKSVISGREHHKNRRLPNFLGNSNVGRSAITSLLSAARRGKKYWYLGDFDKEFFARANEVAESSYGSGKGFLRDRLPKLEKFIELTRKQKLLWVPVTSVTYDAELQPTYDITMPATHTIVTNGLVSHNSDVRLRQTSRALSAAPFSPTADKKKDYNETEASVEFEGKDVYRYVHIKAIKNKLWTPNRTCLIRIWVEDGSGTARGIDPVFDTIAYLKDTGQLSGTRKAFKLDLEGLGKSTKPLTWHQLKQWVLGSKETMTKASTHAGYKPMNLRSFCFKQVASGVAERKYIEVANAKSKAGGDDDGEE